MTKKPSKPPANHVGIRSQITLTKGSCEYSLTARQFNPYAAGGKFGQCEMVQKIWKMTDTLAPGYSYESTQRGLSNEY